MTKLELAILAAHRAHRDQRDQSGTPYLVHVFSVALAVPERSRAVALLHDVLEDGGSIEPALWELLTAAEKEALDLLTHPHGEPYDAYIDRIAVAEGEAGKIAREVKGADVRHNLGRLHRLPVEAAGRLRPRYERALAVLPARAKL